ncbi:MAG: peptide deformylase [Sphingomonadales bacterium]
MAILDIIEAPDARLKVISNPVEGVDDVLRKLMDDMLETMYEAPGIGLAAVQVGVPKRLLVMDISAEDEPADPRHFINPEIVWTSPETAIYNEGCLSLPEYFAEVERPAACRVAFLDYNGNEVILEAEGILATCIQHEIDHLEGILFVDHLSSLKRQMILRKLVKGRKASAE